ncbi:hypothetical protein CsmBV28.1 [Diolcogaster facetosa bracovirus]|uniref:Uncharacterized protein n=3 Tax=root TaxID=1 RepID=R9XJ43_9VIRU|nr:hypothetical protein CsmBV28.1 [Diolcogaster facetosa bracovirus] [Bracoviriform facetosae]YP_009665869.1 hypothetical protein CsmBV28.1 [Diolcogaster facetosa bracovirus] [Bracoviriform facetosae]AGO14384.1 hypothetical protein CsmBV28.1 [Diolcogaster facetosa bracovirus] [Bracoviriform facetosae]AGO14456.1 hypothetical protein CsmBV28.1 [Diolcogaster facetosa bracovirus] [Bracoviriform facetosae]
MVLPKKFAVVKFYDISNLGQNPYKCVPKTWLEYGNSDDVFLRYPTAEELPFSIDRMINYESPLLTWLRHPATFICELDTYEECLFLMAHLDVNLPEECAIMVWKKLSREFKERQIRQQSSSMFYQLWNWFSSVFN